LDRLWAKKCGSLGVLIRYADDFVVMSPTESKAKEALSTNPVCDEQAGFGAASGEDADGELGTWEGKFCVLGMYDPEETKYLAESAAVLHAAVAVAQGDEANPETRS